MKTSKYVYWYEKFEICLFAFVFLHIYLSIHLCLFPFNLSLKPAILASCSCYKIQQISHSLYTNYFSNIEIYFIYQFIVSVFKSSLEQTRFFLKLISYLIIYNIKRLSIDSSLIPSDHISINRPPRVSLYSCGCLSKQFICLL